MNKLNNTDVQTGRSPWRSMLFRGIAAIVFGLVTVLIPQISLLTLIILFGVFAFGDGILELSYAFSRNINKQSKWALALNGLLGVTVGLLAFLSPHLLTKVFVIILAAWCLINGVTQIIHAIEIRKSIDNEWLLILAGAASVIFGVFMLLQPATAILAILWTIAFFVGIYGALLVMLAFKIRNNQQLNI